VNTILLAGLPFQVVGLTALVYSLNPYIPAVAVDGRAKMLQSV